MKNSRDIADPRDAYFIFDHKKCPTFTWCKFPKWIGYIGSDKFLTSQNTFLSVITHAIWLTQSYKLALPHSPLALRLNKAIRVTHELTCDVTSLPTPGPHRNSFDTYCSTIYPRQNPVSSAIPAWHEFICRAVSCATGRLFAPRHIRVYENPGERGEFQSCATPDVQIVGRRKSTGCRCICIHVRVLLGNSASRPRG